MERMDFDLLFRWFVGFGVDDGVGSFEVYRRTVSGCSTPRSLRSS